MNTSLIICDDIRLEADGKILIVGMYPANISIREEGELARQLCFLFYADFPVDNVPKAIAFEVELPGEESRRSDVQMGPVVANEDHTRWFIRHVIITQGTALHAGKIKARMIADGQSHDIPAAWVVLLPAANSEPTA